jgi:hypothetical protein
LVYRLTPDAKRVYYSVRSEAAVKADELDKHLRKARGMEQNIEYLYSLLEPKEGL